MSNKENYFRNVLIYDVLDKSEFFFLNNIKLLKDNKQAINFFKSSISMIDHFEKKLDIKWIENSNDGKNHPDFYFLLADNLLWVFFRNKNNAEKTTSTIEKYFSEVVNSIKVTDKKFIEYLLINGFSDNLLEITVVHDGYYDFIESTNIYGSQVNYSTAYEQIINSNCKIISYCLQPLDETSVITFRDENSVEFSKHMKLSQIIRIIDKLSNYYVQFIKRTV